MRFKIRESVQKMNEWCEINSLNAPVLMGGGVNYSHIIRSIRGVSFSALRNIFSLIGLPVRRLVECIRRTGFVFLCVGIRRHARFFVVSGSEVWGQYE